MRRSARAHVRIKDTIISIGSYEIQVKIINTVNKEVFYAFLVAVELKYRRPKSNNSCCSRIQIRNY